MNHRPYLDWMPAALDGDLALDQRRQLEEHLAACADCQSHWAALNEVQRLFDSEPLAAPRSGFTARFKARLAQQRSRPKVVGGALALGLGALGGAALVLPAGASLLFLTVRVAQQPATTAALYSGLSATALFGNAVLGALFVTLRVLAEWALDHPFTGVVGLAAMALAGVWVYLVRKLVPEVSFR